MSETLNVSGRDVVRPYMTRRQLAEHLQVSQKTVARWQALGMPYERWGQRLCRYDLAEIRSWLERRRAEGWRS